MSFMTITHIRRGFATNSSSMHSILEVEPGQELPAPLNADWVKNHIEEDEFVASDRQSRISYLHAMAADAARYAGEWHDEAECYRRYLQLARVIPGDPLSPEEMRAAELDSLSAYAIPRKIHTQDMDVDFFEHIVHFLLSENIVIFGSPWGAPSWEEQLNGRHANLLECLKTVSRRISENEWTVLDLHDGIKYNIVFDRDGRQTTMPIETARALEMVDVSISNACGRGCSFCYRASIPEGLLADMGNLRKLVEGLKEIDALEMVLGGGEPTEHPDFYRFLQETDFGDLCVSFTTRDLNFIHSLARANGIEESEVIEVIREKIKAVGLSVQTADEVEEAERNLAVFMNPDYRHYSFSPQMVFHVIPGLGWQKVLDAILQKRHSLLLLGMKFTGRNVIADREAYSDVLKEMLKDERIQKHVELSRFRERTRLGVDTKFITDVQSIALEWLQRFSRKSWTDREGVRSAFIDLVAGTMAPCSFGGETVKLDGYDGRSLEQAFERIGVYKPE